MSNDFSFQLRSVNAEGVPLVDGTCLNTPPSTGSELSVSGPTVIAKIKKPGNGIPYCFKVRKTTQYIWEEPWGNEICSNNTWFIRVYTSETPISQFGICIAPTAWDGPCCNSISPGSLSFDHSIVDNVSVDVELDYEFDDPVSAEYLNITVSGSSDGCYHNFCLLNINGSQEFYLIVSPNHTGGGIILGPGNHSIKLSDYGITLVDEILLGFHYCTYLEAGWSGDSFSDFTMGSISLTNEALY